MDMGMIIRRKLVAGVLAVLVILGVLPQHGGRAYGGRIRPSGDERKTVRVGPTEIGICASSVIPFGYQCQELHLTTKDGYILSVQRIQQGRAAGNNITNSSKQPVLIQHGILVDGMSWLLNSPKQNLPLILADNGYDVWVANARGTRFSQRHISLYPINPAFWNWSWDEIVSYDLPTIFDHVFAETQQKIDYIGHSQGTLTALAALSEGKLVNQLKSAALLSPIAYLAHLASPLTLLAVRSFLGDSAYSFGLAEFNPRGWPVHNFIKLLCISPGINCNDLLSAFTGSNCCLNPPTVDILVKDNAQATSTKNLVHFAQSVRDGNVAKYDNVNPDDNMKQYGDTRPPIYNLSNIPHDLPLFISYGGNDALSNVQDVIRLLDTFKLHDKDKLTVQFIKDYGHVDFIMGVNAKDVVYNAIIAFLKQHA